MPDEKQPCPACQGSPLMRAIIVAGAVTYEVGGQATCPVCGGGGKVSPKAATAWQRCLPSKEATAK